MTQTTPTRRTMAERTMTDARQTLEHNDRAGHLQALAQTLLQMANGPMTGDAPAQERAALLAGAAALADRTTTNQTTPDNDQMDKAMAGAVTRLAGRMADLHKAGETWQDLAKRTLAAVAISHGATLAEFPGAMTDEAWWDATADQVCDSF